MKITLGKKIISNDTQKIELKEFRSMNSRIFSNGENNTIMEFYDKDIFYKDNNQYQEIDNRLLDKKDFYHRLQRTPPHPIRTRPPRPVRRECQAHRCGGAGRRGCTGGACCLVCPVQQGGKQPQPACTALQLRRQRHRAAPGANSGGTVRTHELSAESRRNGW